MISTTMHLPTNRQTVYWVILNDSRFGIHCSYAHWVETKGWFVILARINRHGE